MKTKTIYEAQIKTSVLAVAAKAAKSIHPEVTLHLDEEDSLSFWCKDDRKECALTGRMDAPSEALGCVTIRAKAEHVTDLLANLDAKVPVSLSIQEFGDGLLMRLEQGITVRTATVQEAQEDDQPFQPEYKATASCTLDLKEFAKVLAGFKRSADVINVHIRERAGFTAGYMTRGGNDTWVYQTEAKGDQEARFAIALLMAAVKAAKAVGSKAKVQLSKDGPMRITVEGQNGMRCMAYVVSSKPI